MNEHEFDKLIQDASAKELDLPSGFAWDEMNISTPVQTARRKRRRGFFFFLTFVLIISATAGMLRISNNQSTQKDEHSEEPHQEVSRSAQQKKETTSNSTDSLHAHLAIHTEKNTKTTTPEGNQQQSTTNRSSGQKQNLVNALEPNDHPLTLNKTEFSNSEKSNAPLPNTAISANGSTTRDFEKSLPPSESISNEFSIEYPKKIRSISPQDMLSENRPALIDIRSPSIKAASSAKTIEFGVGMNSFRSGREVPFSPSFTLRSLGYTVYGNLHLPIHRRNQITIGFRFNALHYFYSGSLLLSSTVDQNTYELVRSYRAIRHNNYLFTAEMPFGISRTVVKTNKFSVQLALHAAPGVLLATRGTYISNENKSVEKLQLGSGGPQFMLSLGASCSVGYQINANNTIRLQPMFSRHLVTFSYAESSSNQLKPDILFIQLGLARTLR
jgi:hypothetical protein